MLATISMNSFVNNAPAIRRVHRGLANACDAILPGTPQDTDLLSFDPTLQRVMVKSLIG